MSIFASNIDYWAKFHFYNMLGHNDRSKRLETQIYMLLLAFRLHIESIVTGQRVAIRFGHFFRRDRPEIFAAWYHEPRAGCWWNRHGLLLLLPSGNFNSLLLNMAQSK